MNQAVNTKATRVARPEWAWKCIEGTHAHTGRATLIGRRGALNGCLLVLVMGLCASADSFAQTSSLYGPPGARVLTLENSSMLSIVPQATQVGDIITVIVNDAFQVNSEGEIEQRKRANLDAVLQEWIELDGFNIKKAPQRQGDPQVTGALNAQYRAESELESKGGLQFRIAARVVEVRPNGNLVLNARKEMVINDETWEQELTGEIDPEAVLPNRTVLSENVVDLKIRKRERGQVRDGYKRGWFTRLYDRFLPF